MSWSKSRAGTSRNSRGVDKVLGPQMKAVGEVMAIGRTFPEALQKGMRALDIGIMGFGDKLDNVAAGSAESPDGAAFVSGRRRRCINGTPSEEIVKNTGFDPWFVRQMGDIIADSTDDHQQKADARINWMQPIS